MLHPGLYEQVINNALTGELAEIPEARKSVAPIDKAEASKVLAQYLADVVQKGLDNVLDNGGDISAQIGLTNQIVELIQNTTQEADFAVLGVDRRAEQLLALLRETDPRLAVGKTAADIERPETSIAQSSLFTGAVHEPQMFTELKKEIVSADQIDMLVSFIKWSGLRLIMDELWEFTHSGGELRIITTSYMGATDVKAIEELRKLPNTQIKVSYNTKTTRLHAKAYAVHLGEKCDGTCSNAKIGRCIADSSMACLPKAFYTLLPGFRPQPHKGLEYGDVAAQINVGSCAYEMKGIIKKNTMNSGRTSKSVDVLLNTHLLSTSKAGEEIIRQFVEQGLVDNRVDLIAVIAPQYFDNSFKGTLRFLAKLGGKKVMFIELDDVARLIEGNSAIDV